MPEAPSVPVDHWDESNEEPLNSESNTNLHGPLILPNGWGELDTGAVGASVTLMVVGGLLVLPPLPEQDSV
jgi:hypothetical protein